MDNQFQCKKQIMTLMEMIAMAVELPEKSMGLFTGSEKYNRKCVMESQKLKFVIPPEGALERSFLYHIIFHRTSTRRTSEKVEKRVDKKLPSLYTSYQYR